MNPAFGEGGALYDPMRSLLLSLEDETQCHIVLAVADDKAVRQEAMAELAERLSGRYELHEFDFSDPPVHSLPRYCRQVAGERPQCVFGVNLEVLAERDAEAFGDAVHFLNAHREDIWYTRSTVVLWLDQKTWLEVMNRAPDFADWAGAPEELALPEGQAIERTPLGRLSVTEAEKLRWFVRQYRKMLARPNLEPAMAAELRKQLQVAETRLGLIKDVRHEYRLHLIDELKDHLVRGFAPQVGGRVLSLPLAKIFLPLQAVEGRPALAEYAEEDLRRQAEMEVTDELGWRHRREEVEKRLARLKARQAAQRTLGLADLLKERRAVLLGDPGSGKTTITRYVAYALAADDRSHTGRMVRGRLPVLVRLASFGKALEDDRELTLLAYVESRLLPREEFSRCLREAIEAGECLVILDGLDEVTDPDLRFLVTRRIRNLVANHGDNHFLVTSRIVGYDRSPLTWEFTHATLQELRPEDQERFVRLWYEAIRSEIHGGGFVADEASLVEALRTKPQIARMAANPLLLTIMVLMHWRGVKLPSRRVQVYQNATDTLIEYWTAERLPLDAEEVKRILAPIAHFILSSSVSGVIARNDLLPRLREGIVAQRGCSNEEAQRLANELLEALSEQSGIFLERGIGADQQPVYGFLHQTFGEYLAALYLAGEMLEGSFEIERYIHRSAWHESLLLLAGHLSLISPHHANQLIEAILAFPCPYEDVLHRNVLLAADCLADDVQVRPDLRDELIERLAKLLSNEAPQVKGAAKDAFERLAVSRHRSVAGAAVKRLAGDLSDGVTLATLLIRLGQQEAASPLLSALEAKKKSLVIDQVRRLRFEGWPDEASALLLRLQETGELRIGATHHGCYLQPVDLELTERVLGREHARQLLAELLANAKDDKELSILRWMIVLTSESPKIDAILDLTARGIPEYIRFSAATRLLVSEHNTTAIAVLKELARHHSPLWLDASQLLYATGEGSSVNWQSVIDSAILGGSERIAAIRALLRANKFEYALPASLHLLATEENTYLLPLLLDSLTAPSHFELRLAAARWLALEPSGNRARACELLLDAGSIEESLPLFRYLAYEDHDHESQRACLHLLRLGEAASVVPVLIEVAAHGNADLKYEASLALALSNQSPSEAPQGVRRIDLKLNILEDRTAAYSQALADLCRAGEEALDRLPPSTDDAWAFKILGRWSLKRLKSAEIDEIPDEPPSAVSLSAVEFELRSGNVNKARGRLRTILQDSSELSDVTRLKALKLAGAVLDDDLTVLLIQILLDPLASGRAEAASALRRSDSPASRAALLRCRENGDSRVRNEAVEAIIWRCDPCTAKEITLALQHQDRFIRSSAAEVLGKLRETSATEALIAALRDGDDFLRIQSVIALGRLRSMSAVEALIRALGDSSYAVGLHAHIALNRMRDPSVSNLLRNALLDENRSRRIWAARCLANRRDVIAKDGLTAALSHTDQEIQIIAAGALKESKLLRGILSSKVNVSIRASAIEALARVRGIESLNVISKVLDEKSAFVRAEAVAALGAFDDRDSLQRVGHAIEDESHTVRVAAARTLGKRRDPCGVEALILGIGDKHHEVRGSAAEALGLIRDPGAIAPLITALGDEDGGVRMYAVKALGKHAHPVAMKPLLALLNDSIHLVRESAATALSRFRSSEALHPLLIALEDRKSDVAAGAAQSLGRLGDPAAIRPLMASVVDRSSSSAALALGRLGATEALPLLLATAGADPEHVTGILHLDPKGALTVLDRFAIRLQFEDWSRRLRGHALWRLGDDAGAAAAFREAVERDRKYGEVVVPNLLSLAHFHLEAGELDAAKALVEEALEEEPKSAVALLTQAVVLFRGGDVERALAFLERAQWEDWHVADADDLRYDHLWRDSALETLRDLLAYEEPAVPLGQVAEPEDRYDA